MRHNEKQQLTSYETSIQKSNEISMAKLSQGLTLNQMQLLAYAIYSTQKGGKTEFQKYEFEEKFQLDYKTAHAKQDCSKLATLRISTEDLLNDTFSFWNVLIGMEYDRGLFTFTWNPLFLPHILNLKERYITADLTITSKFKSSFSWTLYDYLKAHYGYWHRKLTKEELMRLFCVENVKSYHVNTSVFKQKVLDIAIQELNDYTELTVWYVEQKSGRSITGFDIHWSTGTKIIQATTAQIDELKIIVSAIQRDMFKYMDLNTEKYRKEVIDILRKSEELAIVLDNIEDMTFKEADFNLLRARQYLTRLERLVKLDLEAPEVPFYNWLEERD